MSWQWGNWGLDFSKLILFGIRVNILVNFYTLLSKYVKII